MPLVRKLAPGLWEVRAHITDGIARVLFTVVGAMMLLHGFVKKSQKTPTSDLALAQQRLRHMFTREQFVPHLASGFPWHTPEVAHPDLLSADSWWSRLNPVLAKALVEGAGMNPLAAASVAVQVRTRYLAPAAWHVFPDVQPALTALTASGWNHIILSNHVPELPSLVASLGLAGHFRSVLTSAAVGYEKPHRMAFEAAASAAPVGARLVMVGDSFVADYRGALSAGLEAVLVRGSHPECQRSLPDLKSLVAHLNDA